jgi:hypothetical protein
MGKVYKKLVESFGYIAEAPINATGYDPDKVQYAYQDGKANPNYPGAKPTPGPDTSDYQDPKGLDNVTNDPEQKKDKPKPKPGMTANPGTKAYQHWLTQNGYKVAIDGKYGPETKRVTSDIVNNRLNKATEFKARTGKYAPGEEEFMKAWQDMHGVGAAYNVRPGQGPGTVSLGDAAFVKIMKQYGYDPKTGDPTGSAKPTTGQPGQAGQYKTGALPSKQEDIILNSIGKLEAIFKKYGIKVECAYKDDGSLLTEDDWVLKHINMFTAQEQMEIWKTLSEAELTPFGSVGADIAARRRGAEVASAYKDSLAAGQRYQQGATAAAQNMPQKQSTLSKFGKNLAGRFGMGSGKRAAAKGAAKLGLRAIPYIGTAVLLWDIGSALYDTFATTEIADLDPADQQIIAQEIKNLTDMSKSADYASVSEETKKRVTAILNAANKMAQQAEA